MSSENFCRDALEQFQAGRVNPVVVGEQNAHERPFRNVASGRRERLLTRAVNSRDGRDGHSRDGADRALRQPACQNSPIVSATPIATTATRSAFSFDPSQHHRAAPAADRGGDAR